jgi:capsular exopolysaccharide synthesis family protein
MKKNKITIELYSLLKDIVKNLWVVILCALIGSMGFFLVKHASYKPMYTSSATLTVLNSGSVTASYSTYSISTEKANVLVNVFTEPTIKEYAAAYLEIDRFDGTVSAKVLDQTNFIELKVTSDHPEKAYRLLNAVLKSHHKVSNKIFKNAGVTVISMPTVPSGPSNHISNSNQKLVVMGCATIALALVIAFSLMRNTIKKESDFNEKIESKLIATIAHEDKQMSLKDIRQKKKKGLLIHSNAYISLRFTENFHKIAAKLEHKKNRYGDNVFAITSVAENEGKSTCAANIAVSLADRGNKVMLLDLDFKKPALYKIFSEEETENGELSELLRKNVSFEDFDFRQFKKTSLLLAVNTKADPEYRSLIENGSVFALIEKLKTIYDFVIIDTAPLSLDSSVTDIINMVDKTVLVVRTDTVNVNVLNDSVSIISKISSNLAGCILNDVHMNVLPFSFTGNDESNRYGGYRYGKHSHYGHYGKYPAPKYDIEPIPEEDNNAVQTIPESIDDTDETSEQ